jgi:hypothetical protein
MGILGLADGDLDAMASADEKFAERLGASALPMAGAEA